MDLISVDNLPLKLSLWDLTHILRLINSYLVHFVCRLRWFNTIVNFCPRNICIFYPLVYSVIYFCDHGRLTLGLERNGSHSGRFLLLCVLCCFSQMRLQHLCYANPLSASLHSLSTDCFIYIYTLREVAEVTGSLTFIDNFNISWICFRCKGIYLWLWLESAHSQTMSCTWNVIQRQCSGKREGQHTEPGLKLKDKCCIIFGLSLDSTRDSSCVILDSGPSFSPTLTNWWKISFFLPSSILFSHSWIKTYVGRRPCRGQAEVSPVAQ